MLIRAVVTCDDCKKKFEVTAKPKGKEVVPENLVIAQVFLGIAIPKDSMLEIEGAEEINKRCSQRDGVHRIGLASIAILEAVTS